MLLADLVRSIRSRSALCKQQKPLNVRLESAFCKLKKCVF